MGFNLQTRVFNGERFRLYNEYCDKSDAEQEANKLRSKGWNVRIHDGYELYGVYKRRSASGGKG